MLSLHIPTETALIKAALPDNAAPSRQEPGVAGPDAVAVATRVLHAEAEGLMALARSLNGSFDRAIDILAAVSGRVVVTGMGKSGHVAAKIAATLASTGTPAFFVHPGEASHGDLGMIARGDAVIALSNSGSTPELSDIIAFTRRFSIPLIGMTQRTVSPLAEQADVVLLLPSLPEACPHGLAPTTSTTMMLALGDALAVTLLERRGFTAEDFAVFHPGGHLGRRLLTVADIMHGPDDLPLARAAAPLSEVIVEMTAKSFGCIGVVDRDQRLIGVVTDGDLRRHMNLNLLAEAAGAIMTPAPKTIRRKALAGEALAVMNQWSITSLFVVEDGRPVGIIHIHDCLRAGVV
ncbi:MAG: KpsF/GutQ family sugar-phosphate isomerase [Azospirillaceae bacterium]|nr:KpsF/GutQ family sugar-phosphate isomerase [Azospirillaceae bacterium]